MVVGSHCSARNQVGILSNNLDENETNYLYATQFFGQQVIQSHICSYLIYFSKALQPSSLIHVVIIDEIHEMKPEVVYVCWIFFFVNYIITFLF